MSANLSSINSVWIVVPAAGYGERMGSNVPKQYLMMGNQCLLQHTLSSLFHVPDVQGIVVCLAADDEHFGKLPAACRAQVHTTQGGRTRADSVVQGLRYVLNHANAQTWVLVHDAARPLIHASDIKRLTDAVFNSGATGGILATPVQDTLKRADEYFGIEHTVSRDQLWHAQTPQLFRVGELLDALESAADQRNPAVTITDEASAMEQKGHEPLLVEALQPNFKITRSADLRLAQALLHTQDVTA